MVEPGVAAIAVANDAQPYMDERFSSRLEEALHAALAGGSTRAIVLRGGSRYFSAGASQEALLRAEAVAGVARDAARVPGILLDAPVPLVAAMTGHAIGGGLVLGLWCDLAVLAEESLYGANFMALGFTPGMGCTAVLEEAFGAPLARDLLLTGRLLKGREIRQAAAPIAHAVLERAEVEPRALSLAREIAALPGEATSRLKLSLAAPRRERLEQALARERADQAALLGSAGTRHEIASRYGWAGRRSTP
jgi:enoyl-CoA hydratase/carnithine racemase